MQEHSYWTNLSQAEIAEGLMEMGTPVSQPTAGVLLDDLGFAKRQIEKTIAGGSGNGSVAIIIPMRLPCCGSATPAAATTVVGWHLIAEMK